MATIPVKWYASTMAGSPVVDKNYGDTVNLLDAILVNGFNTKSVTSLTYDPVSGLATLTATSHGYVVDQVVAVSGANETNYNGEWRVKSITTNTVSWSMAAPSANTATGTISVKTPGLGWSIVFSATNKRVYRSNDPLSSKPFLRVDNSLDPVWNASYAVLSKITLAENMTDIDTFVGLRAPYDSTAPTKNEVGTGSGATAINGWFKLWQATGSPSSSPTTAPVAGARYWMIVGDSRGFFINLQANLSLSGTYYGYYSMYVGDYLDYKPGETNSSILIANEYYGSPSASETYSGYYMKLANNFGYTTGFNILSNITGTSNAYASIGTLQSYTSSSSASGYNTTLNYPNSIDDSLVLSKYYIFEYISSTSYHMRGELSGVYYIHNLVQNSLLQQQILSFSDNEKYIISKIGQSYYTNPATIALDISNWR